MELDADVVDSDRPTHTHKHTAQIAEYGALEGDIEASLDYFRSELTL